MNNTEQEHEEQRWTKKVKESKGKNRKERKWISVIWYTLQKEIHTSKQKM